MLVEKDKIGRNLDESSSHSGDGILMAAIFAYRAANAFLEPGIGLLDVMCSAV